jgi:hypothetical protein
LLLILLKKLASALSNRVNRKTETESQTRTVGIFIPSGLKDLKFGKRGLNSEKKPLTLPKRLSGKSLPGRKASIEISSRNNIPVRIIDGSLNRGV